MKTAKEWAAELPGHLLDGPWCGDDGSIEALFTAAMKEAEHVGALRAELHAAEMAAVSDSVENELGSQHLRDQLRLARSIAIGQMGDVVAEVVREHDEQARLCRVNDNIHGWNMHTSCSSALRAVEAKIREMK